MREQRVLALEMAAALGFDDAHWRLDDAVHPFAQSIAPTDVRVTSRFAQDDLNGLFAVLHEVGHGLYERQSDPALARTGLGTGVSLGIHESQSRLWENFVGRSRPFWVRWLPRAQDLFPALRDHTLDGFLRAVNAVRPSLIRVEADEITYPLHVVLRFELEVALIEGDLAVADVPGGLGRGDAAPARRRPCPTTAAARCRTSTGPSGSSATSRPTRWARSPPRSCGRRRARTCPTSTRRWRRARPRPWAAWLAEHVHRHGRRLEPGELLRRATGSSYDPDPLLAHLRAKLAELYGVREPHAHRTLVGCAPMSPRTSPPRGAPPPRWRSCSSWPPRSPARPAPAAATAPAAA